MRWERWRIPLLLAPALTVIVVLFGGGLAYVLLQSLGYQPTLGDTTLTLDAYRSLMFGAEHAEPFWRGLLLSLWISGVTTALAAAFSLGAALIVYNTRAGKRLATFLLQFNLPVPHLVAGIAALFLLSQSGLLSRIGAAAGLLGGPADFPVLVRDAGGIGIIIAYVWKETPFIGVIVLAVLQSLGTDYADMARTLGANRWQRFRHVTLPLIAPALLSASLLVFAFTFGAYEVPELLGVRFPRALPVMAIRLFRDPDLNARPEAMALSTLIALIVIVLVVLSLLISVRAGVIRRRSHG